MAFKKEHDFTSMGKGVELVVRPGNKYGGALAGEHVLVDASELKNSSTTSSCMTLDEADASRTAAEKKREEVNVKANKPSMTKAVIDAELARMSALGAAKDKAKAEELEAKEIAAEKEREQERVTAEAKKTFKAKLKASVPLQKLKKQLDIDEELGKKE